VLEEAKKVTLFIYNHIWTMSLMMKYNNDKELVRPTITRFATQFLQLDSIVNRGGFMYRLCGAKAPHQISLFIFLIL